ncbi:hypothetical protein [Ornithinimicrobium kibberense]|uniref:hypothetical protein n=1 Tax=Ornithinimicrobium kibberense TaxID=282060 RepID=UPI003624277C
MVDPAVVRQLQGAQDLQGLHPLLAQPGVVEQPGALVEARVGQEGLHRTILLDGATGRHPGGGPGRAGPRARQPPAITRLRPRNSASTAPSDCRTTVTSVIPLRP